jgi:hypothetical protein
MDGNLLVDAAGWLGVAVLLLAYALVSTKRMAGDDVWYQALNIAGAVLLVINSSHYGAYPSVVVNVVWIGIAIYALARRERK